MSGASKGKDFEKKFKEDWQKSFSNDSTVIRLYDQMSGFKKVSKNPCDFICYSYPYQYLIECKYTKKTNNNALFCLMIMEF